MDEWLLFIHPFTHSPIVSATLIRPFGSLQLPADGFIVKFVRPLRCCILNGSWPGNSPGSSILLYAC
jgi:hypothetical protein